VRAFDRCGDLSCHFISWWKKKKKKKKMKKEEERSGGKMLNE